MVLTRDLIIPVTRDRKQLSLGGSFHWNYSTNFVLNVSGDLGLTLWPFSPEPISLVENPDP